MIIERTSDEIIVRFKTTEDPLKIQGILDYLRYEELTSKSGATEADIEVLLNNIKKGRWGRIKKEIKFND